MPEITRSQVEETQATATKILLDYVDQQDAKVIENLKARLMRVVTAVNEMIDDPQSDKQQVKSLRDEAADVADKVRSVSSKTATKQEVREADDELAALEEELQKIEVDTSNATTQVVRVVSVGRWAVFAWLFAIVSTIIAFFTFMGAYDEFFPGRPDVLRIVGMIIILSFVFAAFGLIGSLIDNWRTRQRVERNVA